MIHGLDITVALGIDRRVPQDRVRVLLEHVTPRTLTFSGADLDGVELRADDLDWSLGTGAPLTGTAQDLLLVAYGRKLPPGHLHGVSPVGSPRAFQPGAPTEPCITISRYTALGPSPRCVDTLSAG